MRALHTWMLIAASILLGLAAGMSANAEQSEDITLIVSHRINDSVFIARTDEANLEDQKLFTIVCDFGLWTTANLVSQADNGQIVWENYKSRTLSYDTRAPRPGYRQLSSDSVDFFCSKKIEANGNGVFSVRLTEDEATFTKQKPLQKAKSFFRKQREM